MGEGEMKTSENGKMGKWENGKRPAMAKILPAKSEEEKKE